MNTYDFDVFSFCGLPITTAIMPAVIQGENHFNSIIRKFYKHLTITLNSNGSLHYHLVSAIPVNPTNLLRCTQSCSKAASTHPLISSYIRPNRLFIR